MRCPVCHQMLEDQYFSVDSDPGMGGGRTVELSAQCDQGHVHSVDVPASRFVRRDDQ